MNCQHLLSSSAPAIQSAASLPGNKAGLGQARLWLTRCLLWGVFFTGWHGFSQAAAQSGTVIYWGDTSLGQGNPPSNLGPVKSISAGSSHSLAVRTDGTVAAWGTDILGEAIVPPGLNNVKAVAAGVEHSVALKEDGTVVVWGDNSSGQLEVPEGLSGVTAVAAGRYHTVALKDDGTVVAWGANEGTEVQVPAGLSGVAAVAAGARHSVALKEDGTVVAWGDNLEGEATVPPGLSDVVAISAGFFHNLALKADGTVVAWGDNSEGQINVPAGLTDVVLIAAGYYFSLAVKSDGTTVGWGDNAFSQIDDFPTDLSGAFALSAGSGHVLALLAIPQAPDIAITGNDVVIANGDTTPSPADHTHFGAASIVDGSVVRTFTIRNNGDEALNLTGEPLVALTGAQAGDFSVTVLPSTPVAAAGSTTFAVTFTPSAAGNRSATISVANDVAGKSPYTFIIRGTGNIPTGTPTVKLTSPTAKTLSTTLPLLVRGVAGDNDGVERVEVTLNSDAPVLATLESSTKPSSVPFSASVNPVEGPNTLTVVAYDLSGNSSVPVTRTFTFERRYQLTITRDVPPTQTATPDRAGTVALAATPASKATKLGKGVNPQTSAILPGTTVKVTAASRKGHLFSHWTGLPAGAQEAGNVASFVMPAQDEPDLTAVFVEDPFTPLLGAKPVFRGLLLPDTGTAAGNDTVGHLTANLVSSSGAASGKIFMDGLTTSFKAVLLGDGSVWFKSGKNLLPELAFGARSLGMTWDSAGLHLTVTAPGDAVSKGLAQAALYSNSSPAPAALLNRAGKQGYFTLILPAKPQSPPIDSADYPQGTGFGTLTLAKNGTFRLALTLADGTKTTISSALVALDQSPVFAQLPTPGTRAKGGSFLGTLVFDTAPAGSDVTGSDLLWFRPAVTESKKAVTQIYTDGWPQGIAVDALGALYDRNLPVADALDLPDAHPVNGNAELTFADGKLLSSFSITNFNINTSKVAKIPTNDKNFTLTLTQGSGLLKGTFTPNPNWTEPARKLPAFQGVLLQKGASAGGFGFFLSNRLNDTDPESGSVILSAPSP